MQVEECTLGHPTDGALGHLGKDSITELVEEGSPQPSSSIWREEIHTTSFVPRLSLEKLTYLIMCGLGPIKRQLHFSTFYPRLCFSAQSMAPISPKD